MCKLEQIKKEQGVSELWQVDVRRYIMDSIFLKDEVISNCKDKMESPEQKEALSKDAAIYQDSNSSIVKTAIGKKWAGVFDYDYDTSVLANEVYQKTMFPSGIIEPLNFKKNECMIFYNGIYYRGDTMNSWQTTLVEFFRCFGGGYNGYLKHLTINNRNKNKWRIPQQHPAKDWVDFRSDPENYKHPLESYIINFMDVVYTIGNFLPVPLVPRFNAKRASLTNDYWDLTLLAIYYHYIGEDKRNSDGWQDLFRYEGVRRWLGQYGEGQRGWINFVEKNFMQSFVDGKSWEPKPLWEDHFNGGASKMPKGDQFEEFFTEAAERIQKRGKRIAEEYKRRLEEEADNFSLKQPEYED